MISVQVLNEFASVLRRKFGFEWDVIIEALADLQTALDPVRPISIETHTAAERRIADLTIVNPFA